MASVALCQVLTSQIGGVNRPQFGQQVLRSVAAQCPRDRCPSLAYRLEAQRPGIGGEATELHQ